MRRLLVLLGLYAIVSTCLLLFLLTPEEAVKWQPQSTSQKCRCENKVPSTMQSTHRLEKVFTDVVKAQKSNHKLAIVVPYRNRLAELLEFVPHIHTYLTKKKINFQIFIIDQFDVFRFNRGALIDVGFVVAREAGCDYMAMHDVDLLPLNLELDYGFPAKGPFHVAAPHLHPKYHYKTFIGGIVIMTQEQFEKVNGLSTRYWGWGREDDEFYRRLGDAGYKVVRPGNLTTGPSNTFRHLHNDKLRKRDYKRIGAQRQVQWQRDRKTGLSTIAREHRVVNTHELSAGGHDFQMVTVELHCDVKQTPWCEDK
ncbi:beta-1,4-galactosyltransferase 7-like [Sycon ciliatum]|uniref:beta-1,4-galactosyltransferase 7-like n=1 Tax=Sycon ciliatum TaxID=27933 RepID=UPI0020ABA727|eukprot:scpid74241/ scgid16862/ Beta-1,4-galactosyltransferase 7; UDP-Gal:beta-GlcNAc beta-1,4-galactosyltransferase 7; UDP-galactose:beta-N-acetylglucosamine beta-1,4-galactosyltransferase 7; Xylosylprotein 4-beta-galactosyltransferase; Proteoglycan UDP-galactose:beta-xylose beta1,4-galactosyltransferase I; UDP-galactose:beta-xylose beta-1,4-galactosyltransferase; XGPT; XGalT-1; Xylosylprotein beta-1,4-galactosyltransferase